MQSYKSYSMVSPQTVFTYPFQHKKLQIDTIYLHTTGMWVDIEKKKAEMFS